MKEVSAGGVVIQNNQVLILRKFRGDWVLPKGRSENNETLEDTALREVSEESGIDCEIIKYIGFVKYNYRNYQGVDIQKTVHYYKMKEKEGALKHQKEEGFCEAVFTPWKKAVSLLRHSSEKNMVRTIFQEKYSR